MRKYNVYIFGCGNEYNRLSSYLNLYKNLLNVLGIVTSKKQCFEKMDGYPVLILDEMNIAQMDYIIIAVERWKEIYEILRLRGIEEDKIIRHSAFFFPNFEFERYINLKRRKVSILSNSCLGGVIYKELGLRVISPTVNMYCMGKDFLKFVKKYQYYLKLDMQEYKKNKYIEGSLGYESFMPSGILDDTVVWNFNHDIYAKDAIAKWNDHRRKVNFDNIAVIMILYSDEEAKEFDELKIEKKIGIYYKDMKLENVIYCPIW